MIEFPFFRCLLCEKIRLKKQWDVFQFSRFEGKDYVSRVCEDCKGKHFDMFKPEKFVKLVVKALKEKYGIDFEETMEIKTCKEFDVDEKNYKRLDKKTD